MQTRPDTGCAILQYAYTSRQVALAYPAALIGDTTPPQIRAVRTQNVAAGIMIARTTDGVAARATR